MGGVSEDSLLDYFYSTGGNSGRVKNADLLKTFKPFIGHSDLQLRARYREEFKLIIDRIAVVKSENSGASPTRAPATAQWDATDTSASSHPQQDEQMPCGGPDAAAQDQQTGTSFMQVPVIQTQGPSAQSNGDEELDKDSGSKSESEQDEESTGSMGSAAVALDPIEKEWIYSAAGARVPDLWIYTFTHCSVTWSSAYSRPAHSDIWGQRKCEGLQWPSCLPLSERQRTRGSRGRLRAATEQEPKVGVAVSLQEEVGLSRGAGSDRGGEDGVTSAHAPCIQSQKILPL
ncbi:hypothetical protein FQN60_002374, partial [Etheostoma spectabile]